MSALNVIRTWKDGAFRNSLSREQQAMVQEASTGAIELNESDLDAVVGGGFLFDSIITPPPPEPKG